jgi:hypothetical protein
LAARLSMWKVFGPAMAVSRLIAGDFSPAEK